MDIARIAELIGVTETEALQNQYLQRLIQDSELMDGLEIAIELKKASQDRSFLLSNDPFLSNLSQAITRIHDSTVSPTEKLETFFKFCTQYDTDLRACICYSIDLKNEASWKPLMKDVTILKTSAENTRPTPNITASLDQIYRNFDSKLPDTPVSNVVISGEIHYSPATYLAQRMLLVAGKDKGFTHVIAENSPAELQEATPLLLGIESKKPMLLSCTATDGSQRYLRDNAAHFEDRSRDINSARLYKHMQRLGYTIIPGDLDEKDRLQEEFHKTPTEATKEASFGARNQSMAGAAQQTSAPCIILTGANHEMGIDTMLKQAKKEPIIFDLTSLANPDSERGALIAAAQAEKKAERLRKKAESTDTTGAQELMTSAVAEDERGPKSEKKLSAL